MWRGLVYFKKTILHTNPDIFVQYRKQLPAFAAAGANVFALDLLGFGGSAKPLEGVEYSIDAWSDLVADFLRDVVRAADPVLVGNSIGSLVALNVASARPAAGVGGLVLLNVAGGMNSKLLLGEGILPWGLRELVARPLLGLFDWVLTSPATQSLRQLYFDDFRSRENVEAVLQQVYVNSASRVDSELVGSILAPAEDPNALGVFCSILSGDPGPDPRALLPGLDGDDPVPVLLLWGEDDPWTPLAGPTGRHIEVCVLCMCVYLPWVSPEPLQIPLRCALIDFNVCATQAWVTSRNEKVSALVSARPTQLMVLPKCGHCPHDDVPGEVNRLGLSWVFSGSGKS